MTRKEFEDGLLELGFTPSEISEGNERFLLIGGTLFERVNNKTIVVTDNDGFSIRYFPREHVYYGRERRWASVEEKTVTEIIAKFFKPFEL